MAKSYEVIERAGISNECACDAVKTVVKEANEEAHVAWFEVVEQRGRVTENGDIEHQVVVKIGRKRA